MKFTKFFFVAMIGTLCSCVTSLTAKSLDDDWNYTPDQKMLRVRGPVESMEYTYSVPINWMFSTPLYTPDATVFKREYKKMPYPAENEFYGYISFDPQYHFSHNMRVGDYDTIQFATTKQMPKYKKQIDTTKVWLERNDSSMISSIGCEFDIGDGWICEDLHWWHYSSDNLITYVCISHSDGYEECTSNFSYDDDDNLQSVVVCSKGGQDIMPWTVGIIEYYDYKFDNYGNWTSRKAKANIQHTADPYRTRNEPEAPRSEEWTEFRNIKYYKH